MLDADLHTRLKSQVETRAAICEQWLPLWRALLRYQSASEELAIRIKRIRAAMVSRLALVYGPELSTLSDVEHSQLLVTLDILTDFESWGRMREDHGLSIEAARDLWINAIGRMLPAAAGNPAHSNPLAQVSGAVAGMLGVQMNGRRFNRRCASAWARRQGTERRSMGSHHMPAARLSQDAAADQDSGASESHESDLTTPTMRAAPIIVAGKAQDETSEPVEMRRPL